MAEGIAAPGRLGHDTRMKKSIGSLALLALLTTGLAPAHAAVKTRDFEYTQGETTLVGHLAWDDEVKARRPGILVVHEWWGLNEHARKQADRLAQAGYVGLALDMYGKGKVTQHPADAQNFMKDATKDPAVVQARFNAALELLKKDEHVDAEKLGAIGYCFGGRVVLDMAQRGADLDVTASFHGAIPPPADKPDFKGKVLLFNGAADLMIPAEAVGAFVKMLAAAHVDFVFANLPGAKHAFTNPAADKTGVEGLAYNAAADETSWKSLMTQLKLVFP